MRCLFCTSPGDFTIAGNESMPSLPICGSHLFAHTVLAGHLPHDPASWVLTGPVEAMPLLRDASMRWWRYLRGVTLVQAEEQAEAVGEVERLLAESALPEPPTLSIQDEFLAFIQRAQATYGVPGFD